LCYYAHLSAVLELCTHAVVEMHLNHNVYLYHQMMQSLMIWDTQHIPSTDVFF